jgi:Family of unknown function (DUF5684)
MGAVLIAIGVLIYIGLIVFEIAAFWKVFVKAGRPGWAAIIPFYNLYVLLKIAGRPGWWLILFFIPIVSLVIDIIMWIDVSTKFGKSGGFAVGLVLLTPIFVPILGFGAAQYQGQGQGRGQTPGAYQYY